MILHLLTWVSDSSGKSRCKYIPLRFLSVISFVVFFLIEVLWNTDFFVAWHLLSFFLFCVCVSGVSESWVGRELSPIFFYAFSPQLISFVSSLCMCVWEGVWAFSWHRSYSPLHTTSLHPFPLLHLHLSSLIYPSILFRPSVAAAPLSLSITPAVMRLNLSVSTGHAHAHTLYTHTHTL